MLLRAAIAMLALGLSAPPALAGSCSLLALGTGTLTMSSDGTRLGSEEALVPAPVLVTVTNTGSSTLTVSAPVWTATGSGYNPSGESLEVRYSSVGLGGAAHAYTNQQSQVAIPNLILPGTLTIHNRITNAHSFPSGSYGTRTVLTCS